MRLSIFILLLLFFTLNNFAANISPQKLKKINDQATKIEAARAKLPYYKKKIDDFILSNIYKINKAINNGQIYKASDIKNKFSKKNFKINHEGKIKLKILLADTLTEGEFQDYQRWLKKMGVKISLAYYPPFYINSRPKISCYIPFDKIYEISKNKRTAAITSVIAPIVNVGAETTEGDIQLEAKLAREQKEVDGSGIKVGVISDGIQGFENSQNSGDLGTVGYLPGHEYINGMEGRAMMEIEYDLAPNSELCFGSALYGDTSSEQMQTTISDLIGYGCKIIVDDISWPGDPWFQDGDLAQFIANKISYDNIIYISSAGNDAKCMYTGEFFGDANGWNIFYYKAANNYDIQNRFYLDNGKSVNIYLQWADEWKTPDTDYDLYLFNSYGDTVGDGGKTRQEPDSSNNPIEQISYTNNSGVGQDLYIQVKFVSGDDSRQLKVLTYPYELTYTHDYNKSNQYQIYGHAAAEGVISVAAYPAQDSLHLEDFSSYGPTLIYNKYSKDITRNTPTIAATDNVRTSLSGTNYDPFSGTSASAPHIAGIAALYLDYYGWNNNSPENFYNDLTGGADDIDGGTGGVWNNHSGYGKANAYEALGGGPLRVTVDQQNSVGSSIGYIGHWESQWITYPVPKDFYWDEGSTQTLEADTIVIANEKYHDWKEQNSYKIFEHFNIDKNTNTLISQFSPTSPVTVKNELSGNSSGEIFFKDPWVRDTTITPYGKRNRSMEAVPHQYDSPLNLTLDSQHQGVFLDQGYSQGNWAPPYYSVKADAQQTFSAHGENITGYFQYWDGTEVDFEHPNDLETAVVFHAANAEARAVYKGHLASGVARTTGYNNGRRIAKNNNSLYLVYEDNSEIWFTSSTDNGQHWSKEVRLSPARYTDAGGNQHTFAHPSIAYAYSQLYVTWEEIIKNANNQKRHKIAFAYKEVNDTNWQTESIPNSASAWSSNSYMEFPTIAAMKIKKVAVAWQDKTSRKIKVAQAYYEAEYEGYHWSSVSVFPEQGKPVIAMAGGNNYPIKIVWADETLQFKQGKRAGDNLSWSATVDLGEDLPEWYTENNNPSLDVESDGTGYIAWEAFDDAMTDDDILFQKYNLNGSGSPIGSLTIIAEDGAENPSVSYDPDNDKITVLYQYNGQIHRKQKNASSWNYTNLGSGKYPSLSAKASEGAVWSMYNSAPYLLKTEQLQGYLGKTSAVDVIAQKRFYFPEKEHISVVQMTDLTIEDNPLQLNDSLASPPLWLEASNNMQCQMKYLTEKGAQDAVIQFWYEKGDIRSMMDAMTLDWKDSVACKRFTFEPSKSGLSTIFLGFSGPVPVTVNVIPAGGVLTKTPLAENEGYISEPITEYKLCANYPNPFNPATNIKIRLPKDGKVRLSVYNIAGEKVCDLIRGYRSAGEYTVMFDGRNLASGVYFYRLQAGEVVQTKRMLLVK